MVDRVYEKNAAQSAPPAPTDPSVGYPTSGNPAQGVPATVPGDYWYHMITEALRNVIVDAGLTPDHEDLGQLLAALNKKLEPYQRNAYGTIQQKIYSQAVGTNATNKWTLRRPTDDEVMTASSETGVFRVRLVTKGTGSDSGNVFLARNPDGNGWELHTVYRETGTNRPYLFIDGDGVPRVTTDHDNDYDVLMLIEYIDGQTGDPRLTAFGADALLSCIDGQITFTGALPGATTSEKGVIEKASSAEAKAGAPDKFADAAGMLEAIGAYALGVNQTWQDVLGSRMADTIYTNSTGRPILIAVTTEDATSAGLINVSVDGMVIESFRSDESSGGEARFTVSVVVPNGSTYSVYLGASDQLYDWHELR